jgi:hypothetical protein
MQIFKLKEVDLLYPNKVVSHAWGWILTHPNAQVAAKPTYL